MRATLSKLTLVLPIILCCELSIGATLMVDDKLYTTSADTQKREQAEDEVTQMSLELNPESIEEKSDRVGRWIADMLPPEKDKETIASAEASNENSDEAEETESIEEVASSIADEKPAPSKRLSFTYDQLNDAYCAQKTQISELTAKVQRLESNITSDINSQLQMLLMITLMNQMAQNSTAPYAQMDAIPRAHAQRSEQYGAQYGLQMTSLSSLFALSSPGIGGTTNNYTYNSYGRAPENMNLMPQNPFVDNARTMASAQSFNTNLIDNQSAYMPAPFNFQQMPVVNPTQTLAPVQQTLTSPQQTLTSPEQSQTPQAQSAEQRVSSSL